MVLRIWPADAVAGAPSNTGRSLRQALMSLIGAGVTAARPLGGRSGVRPGTPSSTVTATATVWTVKPHAGMLDVQAAAEASPYSYAVDANVTGAVTAANATNPRIDLVYVQLADPAEGDGTAAPGISILYLAGVAAASPVAPALPARSMALARLNVPKTGGGAPSVSWIAPYLQSGIWTVRGTTERNELGGLATLENPVYVWRADAELGSELEVTTGGDVWVRAAGGYRDSWEQRREELSKTSIAGGSTSEVLLAALGPVTIPETGRYLISGGSTVVPAGNAAGSLALSDGTISRTRAYHSQSTTTPISMVTSFARTYNAGQSVGVGLRLTPSGGSAATDHLVKWITIERLS